MKFAVIKTGGKQYKVAQGDALVIEKLPTSEGTVVFDNVLLVADGDTIQVGQPAVPGATVTADIISAGKGKKKMVFRYKSKTRERKKKGHRQFFTKVKITNIAS